MGSFIAFSSGSPLFVNQMILFAKCILTNPKPEENKSVSKIQQQMGLVSDSFSHSEASAFLNSTSHVFLIEVFKKISVKNPIVQFALFTFFC